MRDLTYLGHVDDDDDMPTQTKLQPRLLSWVVYIENTLFENLFASLKFTRTFVIFQNATIVRVFNLKIVTC